MSLPEFLCNRPNGFADRWADRFGTEDLTTHEEQENFTMALLAWEAAIDHDRGRWLRATGMSLESVEESAAERADEPTPHIR